MIYRMTSEGTVSGDRLGGKPNIQSLASRHCYSSQSFHPLVAALGVISLQRAGQPRQTPDDVVVVFSPLKGILPAWASNTLNIS